MTSIFDKHPLDLSGPAKDFDAVTPTDGVDLPQEAIALFVVTGGDISLVTSKGRSVVVPVPDNFILPVGVSRINATGTTASGIFAFLVV